MSDIDSARVTVAMLLGALINLSGPGRYVHWGFIQISVANLVLIALMIVVFVAALFLPFHGRNRRNQ